MANWIQTWNGGFANLDSPLAAVSASEIAHVLSQLCRFGGHTKEFYSVAQHSVLVHTILTQTKNQTPNRDYQLAALFHDAHEAYWGFGDVCTPAKQLNPNFFGSLSEKWDRLIADQLEFDALVFNDPWIKDADQRAMATEKRDLMDLSEIPWCQNISPYGDRIQPLSPAKAEDLFMETYTKINQNATCHPCVFRF